MESNDIVERLREEGFITHMARLTRESKLLHEAADEIERLRAGGCARDQKTTQYCAEAVALQEKCNKLHERCMHLENYIDIECANKEIPMEGEMTADIRIVCEEIRKKRRVSVVLEAWSEELDTVLLKIEDHDLESDLKSGTEVKVPYQSLMHGLDAVRNIIRA